MKRLFAVFTLCATTLIAASAVSGPAAADGRHDGRRHAGQSDRQMSRVYTDRGEHRRAFGGHRDYRYKKYRRHLKRHRHAQIHRHGRSYGRSYGHRRDRHRYWPGPAYAFRFDGGRFILRLD